MSLFTLPRRCIVFTTVFASYIAAQSYKPTGAIVLGGNGGWDYMTADAGSHRLYVSHAGEVEVIDLASGQVAGKVTGMKRIHGIAVASDLNTGFISDGGSNEVVFFDLKTLEVKKKVATGMNPDGIVFDSATKRVFTFNGRSQDATAVNAVNETVEGTIPLGGKPEFPVSDGKGNIYDNIEDKNEIVQIDSETLQVKAHWPIAPCESPSGLAMDLEGRRLFAVCSNKMMAIVDADSGKVVATPAIGQGPDAAGFDAKTKLAFASNGGDGTLSVIKQKSRDSYSEAETIMTAKGARTMALDTKTHSIYLATAEFGPAPAPTAEVPRPRPAIVPDTFKVLIMTYEGSDK